MVSKTFRPNLRAVFGHTQEILTNLCLHFPGKGEKERGRRESRDRKIRIKRRKGEEIRERDQITVTDAFTHRPAPFTYWCDMEVAESCERGCAWDMDGMRGRPGLRVRLERGKRDGVRKPDRKESSGRGCVSFC